MRIWGTILIALLVSVLLEAREIPLQELIAKADNAPVNDAYNTGQSDAGRAALQDVVTYARKAEDSAVRSGKKLKDTEIALRKMADKLRDMKRSANFDDQPPIQSATDELESLRTDLLDHMFEKKKKK
jgi:hypothetical protein